MLKSDMIDMLIMVKLNGLPIFFESKLLELIFSYYYGKSIPNPSQ